MSDDNLQRLITDKMEERQQATAAISHSVRNLCPTHLAEAVKRYVFISSVLTLTGNVWGWILEPPFSADDELVSDGDGNCLSN